MLKEGWDVTNVYTIVPLREAAAAILTEQTIGRGLRLPYGERTGEPLVDRLVLVAHEQFEKVVALAKDSPLIQGNVEQVSEGEVAERKTLTEVPSIVLGNVAEEIRRSEVVMRAVAEEVRVQIAKLPHIGTMEADAREKIIETKTTEMVGTLSKETIGINTFSSFHKQGTVIPYHRLSGRIRSLHHSAWRRRRS